MTDRKASLYIGVKPPHKRYKGKKDMIIIIIKSLLVILSCVKTGALKIYLLSKYDSPPHLIGKSNCFDVLPLFKVEPSDKTT